MNNRESTDIKIPLLRAKSIRTALFSFLSQKEHGRLVKAVQPSIPDIKMMNTEFAIEKLKNKLKKMDNRKHKKSLFKINFLKQMKNLDTLSSLEYEIVEDINKVSLKFDLPKKLKDKNKYWCFKNRRTGLHIILLRNWFDDKLKPYRNKGKENTIEMDKIIQMINNQTKNLRGPNSYLQRHRLLQKEIQRQKASINSKDTPETLFTDKKVAVLLFQGGDFSLAAFENSKEIFHKSEHKYIVRKKAGGKQSNKDKTKKIKSVGSSIRRENERKLLKRIAESIENQKEVLNNCEKIFVNAPGGNINYIQECFGKSDVGREKIVSIDFQTKKAKYEEVKRCFDKLGTAFMFFEN